MKSRQALIFGVHPYKSSVFGDIPGAAADANSLAQILTERFLFDCTRPYVGDWTGEQLREQREKFLDRARDSDIVLFYFAGHGIRVDIGTYLVPAGARISRFPADFLRQCLETNQLVEEFRHHIPKAHKIFVFDCCRNDGRQALEEAADGAPIRFRGAYVAPGENELIVHTTSLDQAAIEAANGSQGGTFVQALVPILREGPPLLHESLQKAADRVIEKTGARQVPTIARGPGFDDFSLQPEGSLYQYGDARKPLVFEKNITAIDFCHSSGRVAIALGQVKNEGEIRVLGKKNKVVQATKLDSKPFALAFASEGSALVVGLGSGQVCRLPVTEKTEPRLAQVSSAPINAIEWAHRRGWLVACASDGFARVLEGDTLSELGFCRHWSSVWCASFHRDGDFFITGSKDGHLRLWCVGKGEHRNGVKEHEPIGESIGLGSAVRCARFSPSGELVAVGTELGVVAVFAFNARDGALTRIFRFVAPRISRLSNRAALLKSAAKALEHKSSPSGRRRLAQLKLGPSRVQNSILSVDFSSDEQVLGYSTSFEGYSLYDIEKRQAAGGIEGYAIRDDDKWPRSNAIRFGQRRLYAGVGRKLHLVDF